MSSVPSTPETLRPGSLPSGATAAVRRATESARRTAQFAAFCAAIVLPLTYLPLLAGGLPFQEAVLLVALLAVHAVALAVGHDYGEDQ